MNASAIEAISTTGFCCIVASSLPAFVAVSSPHETFSRHALFCPSQREVMPSHATSNVAGESEYRPITATQATLWGSRNSRGYQRSRSSTAQRRVRKGMTQSISESACFSLALLYLIVTFVERE